MMGQSQFLLSNPNYVRAQKEAGGMIGIQEVLISIRARRKQPLHTEAGYMTDAFISFISLLTLTAGPYMTGGRVDPRI